MSLSALSALGRTAVDAVVALFLSVLTRPLRMDHVRFEIDAGTSELVVTSLDETASGEVGQYRGVFRWPYVKANLNLVLPYPLAIETAYPLTYRQLRTQLNTRYQIVLEEGEFALTAGGVALHDDDLIATPLLEEFAQFRLYATQASGRYQAGSSFAMIFVQPSARVPLRSLFDRAGVSRPDKLVGGLALA